jgi:hypothetical protein
MKATITCLMGVITETHCPLNLISTILFKQISQMFVFWHFYQYITDSEEIRYGNQLKHSSNLNKHSSNLKQNNTSNTKCNPTLISAIRVQKKTKKQNTPQMFVFWHFYQYITDSEEIRYGNQLRECPPLTLITATHLLYIEWMRFWNKIILQIQNAIQL